MIFALMMACVQIEPAGQVHRPGTADVDALAFAGIETATWDGADGLSATWTPGTSGADILYELEISQEGQILQGIETDFIELSVSGLADGEYSLRVIATSGDARPQDGGRSLHLYIGENRLIFRSNEFFEDAGDVWGEGDIVVATARHEASLLIYDVSDPAKPVQLGRIEDMGYTKDVKIGDGLLFVQGECGCSDIPDGGLYYDHVGIRIFDFADPANPVLLAEIADEPRSIHNLSYGDHTLFASDNTTDMMLVFDVSDPTDPVQINEWLPPMGIVHDQAYVDGLVYVAAWRGFAILDASDPGNLTERVWQGGLVAVHNIWPSEDGQLVFITHETQAGGMDVWDVSNPDDVFQVATYDPYEWTSVHNVLIRGDVAYLSYYQAGLEVLDISDPSQPTRIGWFDTWGFEDHPVIEGHTHAEGLFSGNWGVWPYGDHVAATDTGHGLFVFDFAPASVSAD